MEKIKFGLQNSWGQADYSALKTIAAECDRLGFDSVWFYDHLQFPNYPVLECWTVLSALATATQKVQIGSLVTCNFFRYPSLLAKMAATVDIISNGRLIFGIGAGFNESEATAYGIPFPKARPRNEMLDEAISIVKRLWTEEEVDFKGKHYTLNKAVCAPKPVQKPHPPLWVGGKSEKVLMITAKHADAWNGVFISPDELRQKIARLEQACKEVNRDFQTLEITLMIRIIIAENDTDALKKAEWWREERKGKQTDPQWKYAIVGSPETCSNVLRSYVDLGVTHFNLLFEDAEKLNSLRIFAKEVLPEFQ